jgi:CheY-like chemotaxis protein
MMPGMTGGEVLQQLRLRWPEVPVIMLTAVVEIAKGTLRRGAFDYVQSRSSGNTSTAS